MDQLANAVASSSRLPSAPPPAQVPLPIAPVAAPSQEPSPKSPLEKALVKVDELFALESAAQDHRSQSRRKAPTGAPGIAAACVECRKSKSRCTGEAPGVEACPRCVTRGVTCVWPELGVRGPRKGLTKKQRLLDSIRMDILRSMNDGSGDDASSDGADSRTGYTPSDARTSEGPGRPPLFPRQSSVSTTSTAFNDSQEYDLRAVLRNPLAMFAQQHPLFESLAERRPQGPPTSANTGSISQYSQYYDGGLYQELPESDLSYDPVSLGLLTHDDLVRLVNIYFRFLRPFYFHLDPLQHTPEFLRLNSPFLTTSIAAVAASYDPLSRALAPGLQQHAEALAVRCFELGWKSVEVVQAFGMLAHWASPGKSWRDDRSWAWQGQAMRIASEIRLDLPAQYENLAYYRASFTLTVEDYRRLRDSREVTWTMLTRAHIALGIQTGRVEHIVGLYLTGEPRQKLQLCPPTDPKYNFNASESCNRIVARALHHWAGLRDRYDEGPRGEDKLGEDPKLRERFRSAWQKEMDEWQKQWPDVDDYIRLFSEKILVVLNLISLRFPGGQSTIEVLNLCRSISIKSLQRIATWDETDQDVQLLYASNVILISIAFSAVFLLKLANLLDAGPTPELQERCMHVVSILERVGQHRASGASIAALHAERIRTLLAKAQPADRDPADPAVAAAAAAAAAAAPTGLQEVVVPSFGPGDSFQGLGLSDDVLSFTWPESFSNAAVDFLDAASWDPQMAFGE